MRCRRQQDRLREQQARHAPRASGTSTGAGDDDIQGFSTDISVNVGQQIDFKIDTNATAYSITIYRLGYYGGDGARKIATVTPSATLPQTPAAVHHRRRDRALRLRQLGGLGVVERAVAPRSRASTSPG